MKKIFSFTLTLFFAGNLIGQNVGIGTTTPNASAMLEISSGNKGLLIPQVSLTGITDVTTIPAAANSLLVYNRANAGSGPLVVSPGFYYWNGTVWIPFVVNNNSATSAWLLGGNTGTSANVNYMGNADNQPLAFKINNINAGYLGTTGNTYWGLNSGNVNNTGYSNVAIGVSALSQNTNRSNLVAVGDSALFKNGLGATIASDAVFNTAIGSKALYANTIGSFNSATGYQSLTSNVNGFNNTASGFQSLSQNTFGNANTATGYQTLGSNTVGANNTASGQYALVANNTGSNNTAVGRNALLTNTTGNNNTALGNNADVAGNNLSNATAIGDKALVACSDCLVMGSVNGTNGATSSVKVGIGITSPNERLHVAGNIKADTIKPTGILLTPNAGPGKILTSDAAGIATWQTTNLAPGNIGYGVWGDCATNGNISNYQPVADTPKIGALFGSSTAISGSYAIVGTPGDYVGVSSQGSASIFKFNGTSWVFMQKITDATGAAGDNFGISVSLSGNFAMVGAYTDAVGANFAQGSVIIFQYNGTSWVQVQKITDATGSGGYRFGYSVSVDSVYAIIGAFGEKVGANTSQGSASIYKFNGTNWVLMQKLVNATGNASDNFGYSVSISGNTALIGSPGDDYATVDGGTVSFYKYNGSSWVLSNYLFYNLNAQAGDKLGSSVCIHGSDAMAGMPADDVIVNAALVPDQGSVLAFNYNGSNWQQTILLSDPTGVTNSFFGNSVSFNGNQAIVGTLPTTVAGTATIYQKLGFGWVPMQKISDPGGDAIDKFGAAVALDASTKQFLIGAPKYAVSTGKAIFGKIN